MLSWFFGARTVEGHLQAGQYAPALALLDEALAAQPEEPELLESGLGISPALVADLQAWGARWNDTRPTPRTQADAGRGLLRSEADALVARMRSELRVGLRVVVDLG